MSDKDQKTWHFWVSGRVQGVCYRVCAQYEARRFGLQGWVRNLADGQVEVLASGLVQDLEHLHRWLKQGPEMAQVDSVRMVEEDYTECNGFQIS